MNKIATGIFVLFTVLSPLSCERLTLGQPHGQNLLNQQIEMHLKSESLMLVLGTLEVDHRVPIGIEYSLADKNEPKISIDVDHGTLKDVLDSIVEQEPLYRWEFVDDVINFVPVLHREPFFEVLLNASVKRFDLGKGTIKFQIRDAIGELPEVKQLLQSNHKTLLKYGDYAYSPSIHTEEDVAVSISNTTVRGVLNRVIRDSEHKGWALGWRPGEKDVFEIRF